MFSGRALESLGEFGLIERIEERLRRVPAFPFMSLLKGIGDDAAVFRPREKGSFLLTSDLLIEGVHFKLEYEPLETLGYKALAVNASDIGAMGGEPWGFLLALALPQDFSQDALEKLFLGMASFQEAYPCLALGGDTSKSPSGMMICVTFLGWQPAPSRLLTRDGAREGDRILVVGMPGKAALGLKYLQRFGPSAWNHPEGRPYVEAYLKPTPPIPLAREIAQRGFAHAAIDTSDGLVQDLGHVARLSSLQALLNLDALPLEKLKAASEGLGIQAEGLALSGGEDYGLVLAVPGEFVGEIESLGRKWGIEVYDAGRFERGKPGVWVCQKDKEPFQLKKGGYEHFRDEAPPL